MIQSAFAPQELKILGSRVIPGQATIISIWPLGFTESVPHAGQVEYRLPAAVKDKIRGVVMNAQRMTVPVDNINFSDPTNFDEPEMDAEPNRGYSYLTCCDTQQLLLNHDQSPFVKVSHPVQARSAANGLLNAWASVVTGVSNGRAGLRLLDTARSLDEQLTEMYRDQAVLFRGMILKAQADWAARKYDNVTDTCRLAAKWMGDEYEWSKIQVAADEKTCLLCGEKIAALALKCKHCSAFLPKEYMLSGIDYSTDAAVVAFLNKKPAKNEVKQ